MLALAGAAEAAADEAAPLPAGTAGADDAVLDDLLRKTEQQIATGHVTAPADDSALQTWSLVLQRQAGAPNSPALRKALLEFAALARGRAIEEREAGHLSVSIDFTVFADLATQLLTNSPERAKDAAAAATPPQVASEPPPAPAVPAQTAAPRPVAPGPVAAAPVAPAPTPSPPAPPAPPAPQAPQDPAMAGFYARRGDDMLAKRDISAARKFYEFAANAGSAPAASALARTYEPAVLNELGVVGIKADPAQARFWYDRAASLGDREAAAKLQALGTAAK